MTPDEQQLHARMDGELDEATAQQVERYRRKIPVLPHKWPRCVMKCSIYVMQ